MSLMRTIAALPVALIATASFAGPAFELSDSYDPRADIIPGYYACRSGLDFDTFTWTFDLEADGSYALRGQDGEGKMVVAPGDGTIEFASGPFMSDETATMYARSTTRLSDGNAVIIIRYDFGDTVTDDYCARVE
jgi:hypothetical protein